MASGIRVLEIGLGRKGIRCKEKTEAQRQDQRTKRTVRTRQEAPGDRLLQPETETKRPGVFDISPPVPGPTSVEDTMPKTPPPAYSKTVQPGTAPDTKGSSKGAIVVLDDFVAFGPQRQLLHLFQAHNQRGGQSRHYADRRGPRVLKEDEVRRKSIETVAVEPLLKPRCSRLWQLRNPRATMFG